MLLLLLLLLLLVVVLRLVLVLVLLLLPPPLLSVLRLAACSLPPRLLPRLLFPPFSRLCCGCYCALCRRRQLSCSYQLDTCYERRNER